MNKYYPTKMDSLDVYIDGACINNGQADAKAGYAVFFAHNDPRNECGRVKGKQSNNTGELTAFIRCLEILQEDINKGTKIDIYCDSEYVIKCATRYGSKLESTEWKTSKDKSPPNLELVKKAYELYKATKCVHLHHVRAHTAETDKHSLGNAEVDRMAKSTVGQSDTDVAGTIIRLNIPFANKDKAKDLGARWDANHKYWYVNTKYASEETVNQLLALQQELPDFINISYDKKKDTKKIYINISYDKKEKAKSLGARWDASVKSWYYIDEYISTENKKALQNL